MSTFKTGCISTRSSTSAGAIQLSSHALKRWYSSQATVAMSSLSPYRTNAERERMQALGQERNVQLLLTYNRQLEERQRRRPARRRACAWRHRLLGRELGSAEIEAQGRGA